MPPQPKEKGHWVGYYVEMFFEGDTDDDPSSIFKNQFHMTTPGWTNPNTLPFDDCHGVECKGILV